MFQHGEVVRLKVDVSSFSLWLTGRLNDLRAWHWCSSVVWQRCSFLLGSNLSHIQADPACDKLAISVYDSLYSNMRHFGVWLDFLLGGNIRIRRVPTAICPRGRQLAALGPRLQRSRAQQCRRVDRSTLFWNVWSHVFWRIPEDFFAGGMQSKVRRSTEQSTVGVYQHQQWGRRVASHVPVTQWSNGSWQS